MKIVALVVLLSLSLAAQQPPVQPGSLPNATNSTQNAPLSQRGVERITVAPDGTVTLLGQVSRPTLKSDAERTVKGIEGVERVDNQIEVLPTSPMDDQIRRATYRAIYGNDVLSQYALRAVPPIHIIVKNGHVTLEGVVARQMDKQVAEMQAKSVPNVFSVTNNLRVEEEGK